MPSSLFRRFRNSSLICLQVVILLLSCIPSSALGADLVDPGLVGTWTLPNRALTWEIRSDGTYRITGSNGVLLHEGTFRASRGRWSLQNPFGGDGGTYQLPDPNTFVGTGKFGPGVWVRVGAAGNAGQGRSAGALRMNGNIPVDLPELVQAETAEAKAWREDAVPVMLDFERIDAPNVKGPQVRIYFASPSDCAGRLVVVTDRGTKIREQPRSPGCGFDALPPVFVDLPAAGRIAAKDGMRGTPRRASLKIWKPEGAAAPVLAWMISPEAGEGRTVDGASGKVLDFDVTGYIARYNADWEKAAAGLRALMRTAAGRENDDYWSTPDPDPWKPPDSSNPNAAAEEAARRAAHDQNAAEGRAYWGGSAADYNRVKNGECTWSDSNRFGC